MGNCRNGDWFTPPASPAGCFTISVGLGLKASKQQWRCAWVNPSQRIWVPYCLLTSKQGHKSCSKWLWCQVTCMVWLVRLCSLQGSHRPRWQSKHGLELEPKSVSLRQSVLKKMVHTTWNRVNTTLETELSFLFIMRGSSLLLVRECTETSCHTPRHESIEKSRLFQKCIILHQVAAKIMKWIKCSIRNSNQLFLKDQWIARKCMKKTSKWIKKNNAGYAYKIQLTEIWEDRPKYRKQKSHYEKKKKTLLESLNNRLVQAENFQGWRHSWMRTFRHNK